MTPKQTALRNTAAIFLAGVLASVGVAVIFTMFTVEQIGTGFSALLMIFAGKMVYDIELSKAESLDKLNKNS